MPHNFTGAKSQVHVGDKKGKGKSRLLGAGDAGSGMDKTSKNTGHKKYKPLGPVTHAEGG